MDKNNKKKKNDPTSIVFCNEDLACLNFLVNESKVRGNPIPKSSFIRTGVSEYLDKRFPGRYDPGFNLPDQCETIAKCETIVGEPVVPVVSVDQSIHFVNPDSLTDQLSQKPEGDSS